MNWLVAIGFGCGLLSAIVLWRAVRDPTMRIDDEAQPKKNKAEVTFGENHFEI